MSWSTSNRKARLPKDWQTRRLRVLRRDQYKCQHRNEAGVKCGAPASDVDHIIPGDNHSLSNLQALCRWHHSRKSSAEGAAARRALGTQRRPAERHPGLIE